MLLDKNLFLDNVNLHFLIALTVTAVLNLCQALSCLSSQVIDSGNDRDGSLILHGLQSSCAVWTW